VAAVATSPSALIVANNIPAKTVAELVACSRTVPRKRRASSRNDGPRQLIPPVAAAPASGGRVAGCS
jgi:tripartite-type tricarboxylate transporter receptor subunit TctC